MPLAAGSDALKLAEDDNVAVVLRAVDAGAQIVVGTQPVRALSTIPRGHKIAVRPIERGEIVRKYGQTIGRATTAIAVGAHVHVHNVEGTRGRGDLAAPAGEEA